MKIQIQITLTFGFIIEMENLNFFNKLLRYGSLCEGLYVIVQFYLDVRACLKCDIEYFVTHNFVEDQEVNLWLWGYKISFKTIFPKVNHDWRVIGHFDSFSLTSFLTSDDNIYENGNHILHAIKLSMISISWISVGVKNRCL